MIKCKAIAENSIFVNAAGDIKPCCYLGQEILSLSLTENNFKGLVNSWSSNTPHSVCHTLCDDKSISPINLINIEKSYK